MVSALDFRPKIGGSRPSFCPGFCHYVISFTPHCLSPPWRNPAMDLLLIQGGGGGGGVAILSVASCYSETGDKL